LQPAHPSKTRQKRFILQVCGVSWAKMAPHHTCILSCTKTCSFCFATIQNNII
jgi:hypothetical protein